MKNPLHFCFNGPVAEWLGKALQKLLHRFESGRDLKNQIRHCRRDLLTLFAMTFLFKVMFVKYLHWIGLAACICLIVSCFLPWVYYGDIEQTFTGFYSYKNEYGKPGKFLTIFGILV